jgi:hypothetical protein
MGLGVGCGGGRMKRLDYDGGGRVSGIGCIG